jgi:hypothetical protein
MNANELADALQETEPYYSTDYKLFDQAATMLRQQQEQIKALREYMEAQDKHIVDLAFKLVYAERGNEVAKELSNE